MKPVSYTHLDVYKRQNLHGMGAIMDEMGENKGPKRTQSLPQEEWPAIAEKTRNDYFNGFQEAMKKLREMKK